MVSRKHTSAAKAQSRKSRNPSRPAPAPISHQPKARWPQSVDDKLVTAKNIIQAAIAAEESGNLEGKNYDPAWPLWMAEELLERAIEQLDVESMARRQGGAS